MLIIRIKWPCRLKNNWIVITEYHMEHIKITFITFYLVSTLSYVFQILLYFNTHVEDQYAKPLMLEDTLYVD